MIALAAALASAVPGILRMLGSNHSAQVAGRVVNAAAEAGEAARDEQATEAIRRDVAAQLQSTSGFTADEVEQNAQVLAAGIGAMARRYGMDPLALYRGVGLQVRGRGKEELLWSAAPFRSIDSGYQSPFASKPAARTGQEAPNATGESNSITSIPTGESGDNILFQGKPEGERGPDDFVPTPDGYANFGQIPADIADEIRRQAGPIRLQEGSHGEKGKKQFGRVHIEARHGKEITSLGFESVEAFVFEVLTGADKIWQGKDGALLIGREGPKGRIGVVELRPGPEGQDFYSVRTAYPLRGTRKEELLWSGTPFRSIESGSRPSFADKPATRAGQAAPNATEESNSSANILFDEEDGNTLFQGGPADPFSPSWEAFRGKPDEGIRHLMEARKGVIPEAFFHSEVGVIDLPWGWEGTEAKDYRDGYGLAKILKKHPEVDPLELQEIIFRSAVATRDGNRVVLETPDHKVALRLDWHGEKRSWLVTAFQKVSAPTLGSSAVQSGTDSAPTHPADQEADTTNIPSDEGDGNTLFQSLDFQGKSERADWGAPLDVTVVLSPGAAKKHVDYAAAKAGDRNAALRLANDLLTDEVVASVRRAIGGKTPIVVPVRAEEITDKNKIPSALAVVLSERLGLEQETNIVQTNVVHHTGARAFHRIAFQPVFAGEVRPADYILVDDNLTLGGTLANLRGHIENNGGRVIAGVALTGHPGTARISPDTQKVQALREKHGEALERWWQAEFGHGFDRLTAGEIPHLLKAPDADAVRDRIAQARNEAVRGVDEKDAAGVGRPEEGSKDLGPELLSRRENLTRGSIRFSDGGTIITLMEQADRSTFMHESGHLFVNLLGWLAARPNAPRQIVNDYQTLLDFVGAKSAADLDITGKSGNARSAAVAKQELLARAFEAYLFEGKAPSVALRSAFQRFRAWLVDIYRAVRNLNVKVNDEIRGVFDRMLATDEEIAAAERARKLTPVFGSAEAAGMTPSEFAAYSEAHRRASRAAQDALTRKALEEIRREDTAWWKAARAASRGQVERDVNRRPVFAAKHFLMTGKPLAGALPAGIGPMKLSRAALVAMYGEKGIWKGLPFGKNGVWARRGGVHPDLVADLFGFSSGDEMVKAILKAGNRKQVIEAETDRRMKAEYGDMLRDGTMAARAMTAIHNDERAGFLLREMNLLAERAGEAAMPEPVFRQAAMRLTRGKRVRDIAADRYVRAGTRAADAARKAVADGDFGTAHLEKRKQLLNHYLYMKASAAEEEIGRAVAYLDGFNRRDARERLATSPEGGYLDQIHALLFRFGLGPGIKREITVRHKPLAAWVAEREADGAQVNVPAALLDDHPKAQAFLNRPEPPPPVTVAEVMVALDEIATALPVPPAGRTKLDALMARLA